MLPVDTVVVAIGAMINGLLAQTTPGMQTDKRGNLIVDKKTQMTTRPGVYAGGDIAGGEATVIAAMGQGRTAAQAICEYVSK